MVFFLMGDNVVRFSSSNVFLAPKPPCSRAIFRMAISSKHFYLFHLPELQIPKSGDVDLVP